MNEYKATLVIVDHSLTPAAFTDVRSYLTARAQAGDTAAGAALEHAEAFDAFLGRDSVAGGAEPWPALTAPLFPHTPWVAKRLDVHHSCIFDSTGMLVVPKMTTERQGLEANDIAQAVNAHDEIVAAMEYAVTFSDVDINPVIRKRLIAAIAKAKGRQS